MISLRKLFVSFNFVYILCLYSTLLGMWCCFLSFYLSCWMYIRSFLKGFFRAGYMNRSLDGPNLLGIMVIFSDTFHARQ